MFHSDINVDSCISLQKKHVQTTVKPRTVSFQGGGDDVAINAICSHQEITRVKSVHEKILVTEPTVKSKIEEYLMIGKIQLRIPSSDPKPMEIKPNFRTPPRWINIGSLPICIA
jgi:hypothetical protein